MVKVEVVDNKEGVAELAGDIDAAVFDVESKPNEVLPKANHQDPTFNGGPIKKPQSQFIRILKTKKFWFLLLFGLISLGAALWFLQPTRVAFVNSLGYRQVVKVSTRTQATPDQPSLELKNVNLNVNGAEFSSGELSTMEIEVEYGQTNILAQKTGYEPSSFSAFYDFNPFFGLIGNANNQPAQVEMQLKSVGVPVVFAVKDWLSSKPITQGRFTVNDIVAVPNDKGVVAVVIPPTTATTLTVKPDLGSDYNNYDFAVKVQDEPLQEQLFVPAGKAYYVANKGGGLAVYKSDIDGTKEELLVPASSNETSAIAVAVGSNKEFGMLASTREGVRDSSGQLVQKLYTLNLTSGALKEVDRAPSFRFIDFAGSRFAYIKNQSNVQNLMTVDITNGAKNEIAPAGSFGEARVSVDKLLFTLYDAAGSSGVQNDPELHVAPVGGGSEKNIGEKVSNLTQVSWEVFVYQSADGKWHEYNTNTDQVANAAAPAIADNNYLNSTSGNGQFRLFVTNPSQPIVNLQSVANGEQKALSGANGMQAPLYWANNTIIFRVITGGKAADYALSPNGGEPRKVVDVIETVNLAPAGGQFTFF